MCQFLYTDIQVTNMPLTRAQQAAAYYARKRRRVEAEGYIVTLSSDPSSPTVAATATAGTAVSTLSIDRQLTDVTYELTSNPDDIFQISGDALQIQTQPSSQGYVATNTIDITIVAKFWAAGQSDTPLSLTVTLT